MELNKALVHLSTLVKINVASFDFLGQDLVACIFRYDVIMSGILILAMDFLY